MSTSQGRLRLADHVRACADGGQVVLLDLRRSRYIGIGGGQSHVLSRAVEGWPSQDAAPDSATDSLDIDSFAAPLLAQGLLTRAPSADGRHIVLDEPTSSLNAEDAVSHRALGSRLACRLLHAATVTAVQLRVRSLAAIAQAATDRRARSRHAAGPCSMGALREVVAAYVQLRLYVFTAHDRCLHDSLTLLRFLAAEDLFPRWVIGVRTRPFAAHSWLQSGHTVLNDQHETVRHYRPILVV